MASPAETSGGGASQMAGGLAKEMQQMQSDLQQQQKGKQVGPNEGFQNALNSTQTQGTAQALSSQQVAQSTGVNQAQGQVGSQVGVRDVLREAKAKMTPSTRVGATEKTEESKLTKMIDNLVNGQDKMTKIMHLALSGRQFSPTELLAMQAGVYRFSQELDLTSKVVEKASGGIKQTLNTQV
jgi:hypothetical protein